MVTYSNNVSAAAATDALAPTIQITGIGNYTGQITKTFTIVDYKDIVEIWYNNKPTKLDWYRKKVEISSPGYTIGTSETGSFSSKYTISEEGIGVGANLYFKKTSTGEVTPVIAVSVNIDMTSPTGSITVGDYKSNESDELGLITTDQKKIKVASKDKFSGVDTVEYFIGTKIYSNNSSIESAGGSKWAEYDSESKPKLKKDKVNYIYVKLTDVAGNVSYLSTKGIACDTVGPAISALTDKLVENQGAVLVTATDEVSGDILQAGSGSRNAQG